MLVINVKTQRERILIKTSDGDIILYFDQNYFKQVQIGVEAPKTIPINRFNILSEEETEAAKE